MVDHHQGVGGGGGGGGVFCYVNSVFAPGLDEGVGGLWRVSFFFRFFRVEGGGGELEGLGLVRGGGGRGR